MNQLLLAPAERAQILVDLRGGDGRRVVLTSESGAVVPDLYRTSMAIDVHDRRGFDLLELRVRPSLALGTRLPEHLVDQPSLELDGPARRFVMNGMIVSDAFARMQAGHGYAPRAANGPGGKRHYQGLASHQRQPHGASVPHARHVVFLIRSRGGRPPAPHERSWDDGVLVRGGETVALIALFDHPADRGACVHVPLAYPRARGQRHDGVVLC